MDGPALHAALRREGLVARVLFVSGHRGDELPAPLAAPDAPFLAKPFVPSELLARVRDVLDGAERGAPAPPRARAEPADTAATADTAVTADAAEAPPASVAAPPAGDGEPVA
jgi:DNA-binding response OmpR family regulator